MEAKTSTLISSYTLYLFIVQYIITYVVIQFYNNKKRNSEIQISDPPYEADNKITKTLLTVMD